MLQVRETGRHPGSQRRRRRKQTAPVAVRQGTPFALATPPARVRGGRLRIVCRTQPWLLGTRGW